MAFRQFVTLTFMQYVTLSEAEGSPSIKQIAPIFAARYCAIIYRVLCPPLLTRKASILEA